MRSYLFLIFFLAFTFNIAAQVQQKFYKSNGQHIHIRDAKFDQDSNLVQVGYFSNDAMGWFVDSSFIMKTTSSGELIWMKTGFEIPYTKIVMANNGDYLVLGQDWGGEVLRYNKSGVLKWGGSYSFSNNLEHNVYGLAELPDGRLAIAGYNDFDGSSWNNWEGYIRILDSMGQELDLKRFGPSWLARSYLFNDIAIVGNRIIVAGGYDGYGGEIGKPMIMLLNFSLDSIVVRHLLNPLAGTGEARFNQVSLVDSKIMLSGVASDTDLVNGTGKYHFICTYDTVTYALKGKLYSVGQYPYVGNSAIFIKDSSTYYISMSPQVSPYLQRTKTFTAKIQNNAIQYARSIEHDSAISVSGVIQNYDSLWLFGKLRHYGKKQGYFGKFPELMPLNAICGIEDTVIAQDSFDYTLVPLPDGTDITDFQGNWFGYLLYDRTACMKEIFLCGDTTACPSDLTASLSSTGPLTVCAGDTVWLSASTNCYHHTWLFNGVNMQSEETVMPVTQSGDYVLVVDNNLCFDTSIIMSVNILPLVSPIIIQPSAGTLSTGTYSSYQWYLDGNLINGAVLQNYNPVQSGNYTVLVSDSNGCSGSSIIFPFVITEISTIEGGNIYIYPNPAKDVLILERGDYSGNPVTCNVTDLTGKVLLTKVINSNKGSISIEHLAAGTYILYCNNDKQVQRLKITKY